ncbi:GntR family transcriptional regulator [Actinoallomurus bryophytorum]|uniref:GntR family transcriptional regulator n=2 Tax=Actinoallomurus bryophytorum TaxID=1490222 RepID=A0A543CTA8_9ACTN|nr:GntR family transcriptional regulator [Actinoallomurus bryophytorum]
MGIGHGGSGLDLHLELAKNAGGVGRALEAALREAMRSGRLAPGVLLPGSRSLAADLGLSRGTVVQVYAQLAAEGWLTGTPGSGTRVAGLPAGSTGEERGGEPEHDERTRTGLAADGPARRWEADLRPGRPDLSSFPRGAWASSVRRAVSMADAALFDYGEPAGVPPLRAAVADYVSRTRGARVTAGSVVITGGFSSGLALLARTFHRLGVRRAAVEDPCLRRHREMLCAAGLGLDPLTVDAEGADPSGLRDGTGVVLLTPAHQHPRGVVLAPARRAAFVEWARRGDGYLIEDDYDGEFRYDRQPVGALQALGPDRVVLGGTAGKALAPGMRIGWLVTPPALREPLLEVIEETSAAVPVIDQLALADLIARGDYDRHIRRLRLVYRRRRTELAERLATVTATPLEGVSAGLHALLPVDSADRERRLVAAGEDAGLRLHGLYTFGYWHAPSDRPAALVLGYASPPQHAWRRSLDLLTAVLQAGP